MQVENEHYTTVSGLIRLVVSLECFIEMFVITCTVNFTATSSLLFESPYTTCDCHIRLPSPLYRQVKPSLSLVRALQSTCAFLPHSLP